MIVDLMMVNYSEAASFQEGLEETWTVIELRLSRVLWRSLQMTNMIESVSPQFEMLVVMRIIGVMAE